MTVGDAAEGASRCMMGYVVLDPDRASVHPTLDALDLLPRREEVDRCRGSSCSEQILDPVEEVGQHDVQQERRCLGGSGSARAC
jgi:hypothetical protein